MSVITALLDVINFIVTEGAMLLPVYMIDPGNFGVSKALVISKAKSPNSAFLRGNRR